MHATVTRVGMENRKVEKRFRVSALFYIHASLPHEAFAALLVPTLHTILGIHYRRFGVAAFTGTGAWRNLDALDSPSVLTVLSRCPRSHTHLLGLGCPRKGSTRRGRQFHKHKSLPPMRNRGVAKHTISGNSFTSINKPLPGA